LILQQVNGDSKTNGPEINVAATAQKLGELQFEEEEDDSYYSKVCVLEMMCINCYISELIYIF